MSDNNFYNDFCNAFMKSDYGKMKIEHESRLEIVFRKNEFEKNLDEMWAVYKKGNTKQIIGYNKQIDYLKSLNIKIYRNSEGKHKLVF